MKKPLLSQAVEVFMADVMYSAKKVKNARDKALVTKFKQVEVKQELSQILNAAVHKFKKVELLKITNYENRIADFKTEITNFSRVNKTSSLLRLGKLEKLNNDLKTKLNDYIEDGQDKWNFFVKKYNFEMGILEKGMKEFTINNLDLIHI